jgi:multisubunit Na+/H+ antiporter MnhB subunit
MPRMKAKALVALFIAALGAYLWARGATWTVVFHEEPGHFAEMARAAGIRNLVTLVYLGPRIADTLLEVMVVVFAVYGMKYVAEAP